MLSKMDKLVNNLILEQSSHCGTSERSSISLNTNTNTDKDLNKHDTLHILNNKNIPSNMLMNNDNYNDKDFDDVLMDNATLNNDLQEDNFFLTNLNINKDKD